MDRPARIVAGEEQDMTDRELLEAAAKSAGLLIGFSESTHDYGRPYVWNDDNKTSRWWNPLTDDADALRLAVKLGMLVDVWLQQKVCTASNQGEEVVDAKVEFGADPYAVTRRAIVRAAAEIGRSKT
jgi:hypothetical protein